MAIVTRRYRWNGGADLLALQNVGDPGTTMATLGYGAHVDVTFDDAIANSIVVDIQMFARGFTFETAAPAGTPLFDITDALRFTERVGDPTAEADNGLVYSKDVAGVTQLFTRASDGTITQLTPTQRSSIMVWGNDTILAAADTRFIQPGRGVSASLTDVYQFPSPRAGTLRNLYIRHNATQGNGNVVNYTVMVNGAATAIVASLVSGAVGQASNLVNTAAVAQGDRISIRAVKPASIANGALDLQVTVELA